MSATRCTSPTGPPCTRLLQPNSLHGSDLPDHLCPAVAARSVSDWLRRHPPSGAVFTLPDGTPATATGDPAAPVITLDPADARPIAYLGLVLQRWAEEPTASKNLLRLASDPRWIQAVGDVLPLAQVLLTPRAVVTGNPLRGTTEGALQRHGLPHNPATLEWTLRRVAVIATDKDPAGLVRDPARLARIVAGCSPDPDPRRGVAWEGLLVSPSPPGERPEPWDAFARLPVTYVHPSVRELRAVVTDDVRDMREWAQVALGVRFFRDLVEDARAANVAGGRPPRKTENSNEEIDT